MCNGEKTVVILWKKNKNRTLSTEVLGKTWDYKYCIEFCNNALSVVEKMTFEYVYL